MGVRLHKALLIRSSRMEGLRCMLVNLDGVIAVVVAEGRKPGRMEKGLPEAGEVIFGRLGGEEGKTKAGAESEAEAKAGAESEAEAEAEAEAKAKAEAEAAWVDLEELIPLLERSFK